jgi:hypothetical protein
LIMGIERLIMDDRIFFSQPHSHGTCPRPVRTIVEGIRTLGFAILDIRPLRAVHGDRHRCSSPSPSLPEPPSWKASWKNMLSILTLCLCKVYLGPSLLHRRSLYNHIAPSSPSPPDHRLRRSDLRTYSLLCHQHVRSLL